ncbi:MAG: SdiA-regulated domain-containing protein, partial [Bacteroidota bacterium]
IDDEQEEVFIIDVQRQTIIDRIKTGEERDYEGVAFANGRIYVLESDGDIFIGQPQQKGKFQKTETTLSRKQDTEGLGYDSEKQRLLIASKVNKAKTVQLFQLSLESDDAEVVPWLSIPLKGKNGSFQRSSFRPSAIARHPISGMVYLLSSADHSLALMNDQGKVIHVASLPESLYPQAEGLCFSPDGTLYICNEGKNGVSNILVFSPN